MNPLYQANIPTALTVSSLSELYRSGRITPQAVVETIINRSAECAEMNIWITPPDLKGIQPYIDGLAEMDIATTPLWGIPFAIKDNIDLADVATTAGCSDYSYVPKKHATVVERLIRAGAIPLGKTNMDQFATGLVGMRSPYGETHNALRPELISGGSSSGSAVAVATGLAAFALGTDTAGSGRVPAALNGLVGFKPSLGAWSNKGVVPACASIDCVTVFARSAEDVWEVDRVVRGRDDRDPWSRSVELAAAEKPHRFLLPDGPLKFYGPFARQYELAWKRTVERITQLKVNVQYIDVKFFMEAAELLYQGPWVAERWSDLGAFVEGHSEAVLPVTEQVLRMGTKPEFDAASVFRTQHELQALKLQTRSLLQDAVLVLPTCGGTWTREQVRQEPISANAAMGRYTNHCNLLDLSAIALPLGEADSRLPFGITLFALSHQEHILRGAERYIGKLTDTTLVAVCGLHMQGFPLELQMLECGARFIKEAATTADYRLVRLPTDPAKPGLIKLRKGGASVSLEVWEMPTAVFGAFVASIPSPLGIGKIALADGTSVSGFVCESYVSELPNVEDITHFGGWYKYSAAMELTVNT